MSSGDGDFLLFVISSSLFDIPFLNHQIIKSKILRYLLFNLFFFSLFLIRVIGAIRG